MKHIFLALLVSVSFVSRAEEGILTTCPDHFDVQLLDHNKQSREPIFIRFSFVQSSDQEACSFPEYAFEKAFIGMTDGFWDDVNVTQIHKRYGGHYVSYLSLYGSSRTVIRDGSSIIGNLKLIDGRLFLEPIVPYTFVPSEFSLYFEY